MRFYVFTPGQPGYIAAEVAVRDLKGFDEAHSWANDSWALHSNRIISRSEALMRPVYRQALEAWERGDDGVMQTTEVAQIRSDVRSEAAGIAELGCREAASALVAGDDERIYAVVARRSLRGPLLRRRADDATAERRSLIALPLLEVHCSVLRFLAVHHQDPRLTQN